MYGTGANNEFVPFPNAKKFGEERLSRVSLVPSSVYVY